MKHLKDMPGKDSVIKKGHPSYHPKSTLHFLWEAPEKQSLGLKSINWS